MANRSVLAADIGSVSIALAQVDERRTVIRCEHRAHGGRVAETLRLMLEAWDLTRVHAVAATRETPDLVRAGRRIDWISALVTAHRRLSPNAPNLLVVGGERFALVRFDPDGNYRSSRGNSSCAAGTGGFLDQQAVRLGLAGPAQLAELAASNTGMRPKVASRCSVFAKTDLIHAQQEGYSLPEICDGLCAGLARNLVDALVSGEHPRGDVVMAGGVALNRAVVNHVASILDAEVTAPELAPVYACVGAAIAALDAEVELGAPLGTVDAIIAPGATTRSYYHVPLPEPSDYPDFDAHEHFVHETDVVPGARVEVDRYRTPLTSPTPRSLFLGVDVGSTSTKAVLAAPDGEPWSAFYTRTAGAPIRAIRAILETIDATRSAVAPIGGVGCTGSGRKLIGGVVGADLVLDEISAHARAATELNPQIDTIVEIGGQDAKFTTLRRGRVTFSQMNAVCAAGTGSFLEEQAGRLGVPLAEYADRAIGIPAPLTSDRCTVFMERDINHYLNKGYATDELLAAALHSVRENYLQKVAHVAAIGDVVCFQGATAKNRALVAAFEQRLGRPIIVSRYCHVTGALGAALTCRDEMSGATRFRGLDLYRKEIPIRSERCSLCTNHCRLTVADVDGHDVAYGFLCGRDYATPSFVSANTSGFDLMATRRRILREVTRTPGARGTLRTERTVGIPTGLHLAEEHAFWRRVFAELGVRTVVPSGRESTVVRGKQVQGAEFCSPMAAFHGEVIGLLEHSDLVFAPVHLSRQESRERDRAYCYYTQFSPSVVKGALPADDAARLCMPVLWGGGRDPAEELVRSFEPLIALDVEEVRAAMRTARDAQERAAEALRVEFASQRETAAVDVVLVGRPYTALDPAMNKNIPDIFGRHGTRCYSQDMLPRSLPSEVSRELIESVHWRYAADILLAADSIARTPGLYAVLVTSFKCAPDAFCIDAFKRIMDERDKPYLILQLDEHDSSVGYETRIEAAIRAFRNHHHDAGAGLQLVQRERSNRRPAEYSESSGRARLRFPNLRRVFSPESSDVASRLEQYHDQSILSPLEEAIGNRTLLFPSWDPITSPLLAANLRAHGIRAVALTETPLAIQKSMRLNTGQCIPVSAIAQEAMDFVRDRKLDPARTVLWMGRARWSCGIPLYPRFLKSTFEAEGMPELGVYVGDFTYTDISPGATIGAYFAYQFGGWLRRIACRVRPYELAPGTTDALVATWQTRLETLFEYGGNRLRALGTMAREFREIETRDERRPKVGIFGDLYVRDNDVMNQDLIRTIEEAGGEAVTTPYSDYVKIIAASHFEKMARRRELANMAKLRLILAAVGRLERRYHREVADFVGPLVEWRRDGLEGELARFNLVLEQAGESYENALKILHLVDRHPDIALFVQTSPAFCCPSLVTEALSGLIEQVMGVPIVTVTYDGTGGDKNGAIIPYIRFPRRGSRSGDEKTA